MGNKHSNRKNNTTYVCSASSNMQKHELTNETPPPYDQIDKATAMKYINQNSNNQGNPIPKIKVVEVDLNFKGGNTLDDFQKRCVIVNNSNFNFDDICGLDIIISADADTVNFSLYDPYIIDLAKKRCKKMSLVNIDFVNTLYKNTLGIIKNGINYDVEIHIAKPDMTMYDFNSITKYNNIIHVFHAIYCIYKYYKGEWKNNGRFCKLFGKDCPVMPLQYTIYNGIPDEVYNNEPLYKDTIAENQNGDAYIDINSLSLEKYNDIRIIFNIDPLIITKYVEHRKHKLDMNSQPAAITTNTSLSAANTYV